MNSHTILSLIVILFNISCLPAVHPGCRCYLFQSTGKSFGVFKSPNHPHSYPRDLGCIIYSFVADVNEIVEITFNTFNLPPRKTNNKCSDYVRLFINLDRAELNENDTPNYELCGGHSDMPQSTFYSRSRVLLLELTTKTGRRNEYNADYLQEQDSFTGTFRFYNRDNFLNDAIEEKSTCSMSIRSPQFSPKKGGPYQNGGKFFSPRYPQNYPMLSHCVYKLSGGPEQRVMVTFIYIQIENFDNRCVPHRDNDLLVVREGLQTNGRKLATFCGKIENVQIVSHGPDLLIQFMSNANNIEGKGFHAEYSFVSKHTVRPTPFQSNDDTEVIPNEQQTIKSRVEFKSKDNLRGTFRSPSYSTSYPRPIERSYHFIGDANQQVQIDFDTFDLGGDRSTPCSSYSRDRVLIYDGDGDSSDAKLITELCGNEAKSFKSTGYHLTMKLIADNPSNKPGSGFQGTYRFEDKRVSKAASDNGAAPREVNCNYKVDSKGSQTFGFISNYPENEATVDGECLWELVGVYGERIRLKVDRLTYLGDHRFGRPICQNEEFIKVYVYQRGSNNDVHRSDVITLCDKETIPYIMSTEIPRMDVIYKTKYKRLKDFALQYSFVRDYAVRADHGNHLAPDCRFEFHSVNSPLGNFSSPNYPGYYPFDITCEYKFFGRINQGVYVQFKDFEVDNGYPNCQNLESDYVEMTDCRASNIGPTQIRRLCNNPRDLQPFKVVWQSPCLLIRFVSNSRFIRRGFLATYDFKDLQGFQSASNNGPRGFSAILTPFPLYLTLSFDAIVLLLYYSNVKTSFITLLIKQLDSFYTYR